MYDENGVLKYLLSDVCMWGGCDYISWTVSSMNLDALMFGAYMIRILVDFSFDEYIVQVLVPDLMAQGMYLLCDSDQNT